MNERKLSDEMGTDLTREIIIYSFYLLRLGLYDLKAGLTQEMRASRSNLPDTEIN